MNEAAMIGTSGSWSPDAVLASFGSRIERLADQGGTGPSAAFERALAEELQKAGDFDPFNFGPDPQNGAVLDKAGESRWIAALATAAPLASDIADRDATDAVTSSSSRRVGFGDDDASARLSNGGGDHADQGSEPGDETAFWIGERVISHPALKALDRAEAKDRFVEPALTDRVFFNGDGRPIVLPSMDLGDHAAVDTGDAPDADGDLMILPNGAVMAYDPWTVAADGPLRDGVPAH